MIGRRQNYIMDFPPVCALGVRCWTIQLQNMSCNQKKTGTMSECSVQNSHVGNEILVLLHRAALGAADDSPGEVPCELF